MGYGAEAVAQPPLVGFEVAVVLYGLEFAVEQHSLSAAGHVELGEIHFQVALDAAVVDKEAPLQLPPRGGEV